MTPAEIVLPVFVRVGERPESRVGEITLAVVDGEVKVSALRTEMAAMFRAVAEAIENPSEDDKGVEDAAPR